MTNEAEDRITRLENAIADYITEARIERDEIRQHRKELRELLTKLLTGVVDLIDLKKTARDAISTMIDFLDRYSR